MSLGRIIILAVSCLVSVEAQVSGINSVVDLSHWNSRVDLAAAKADGIAGVIHKATQGLTNIDNQYAARTAQAKQVGLKWGAYHFADNTSGVDQAEHFLKVIGNDPEILMALDVEENPNGKTVNLQSAEDFVRTVYQARGRYPLVYGAGFLKNLVRGSNSILLNCPLWVAQWGPKPLISQNSWSTWTLWQYTDGRVGPQPHSVNGIGLCDRDTINNEVHPTIEHMWKNAGLPNQTKGH